MPTVLIVEDDANLRKAFRLALQKEGFEVRESSNGLEAFRAIDADPPDAIVLDLGLPFVDGTLVLHEIQQRVATQAIPIIVVTGRSGSFAHLAAERILLKPVDGKTLVQAVRDSLRR